MIGLRRPPPDDGSGVFACCLFACVFVVGMRARAGDAQMNAWIKHKHKHKRNPTENQHGRGTSRPRVAALTLGAWLETRKIQISHLRQRFSALCVSPLVPLQRPRLGRASKAPPESKSRGQVSGKRVDLGAVGKRDASTDTSIIRQDPAKETSDHAEVGLGLGRHRVQSPTREGQKWSEGHSDVVRMQRKGVLLAIPATANPSRRGSASQRASAQSKRPHHSFTTGHSILILLLFLIC
ncbi:hypothetical protein V8C34DRAFT_325447 [Trichoderma compactum]